MPPVAVDDARRQTAAERRGNVIRALTREFDLESSASSASRLRTLLRGSPRRVIMSGDIDGLVSAAMLARVAPEWRVVAVVVKSGGVLLHPDFRAELSVDECFGVDVFSTYLDNVSNHVALWGSKKPASNGIAAIAAKAYDDEVKRRSEATLLATPSLWADINGSYPDEAIRPKAACYRYPLGTAQVLLALLEAIEMSPRMFDRDYLPWLVANCDGGLKTFGEYAYNVPMWWSCLAAVVGPASLSEQLFQTAANQRATTFVDTVNRLRAEGNAAAAHLDDNWNLRNQSQAALSTVTAWLTSLSGWPDPFLEGADALDGWAYIPFVDHGHLLTSGLPSGADTEERLENFRYGLRRSLGAIHTNFNFFDNRQRLNWVAPWEGLAVVPPPIPPALHPAAATPPPTGPQDDGDFAI